MKKIKDWCRMDGEYLTDCYDPPKIVELKKREYRIRQVMDNVEECVRWEDLENHVHEGVVREFSYKVAVDEFEERSVEYPADWREALKERFAPSWIKKRFPVKTAKVVCSLEHIYPDIDVRLHDRSPTIRFAVSEPRTDVKDADSR